MQRKSMGHSRRKQGEQGMPGGAQDLRRAADTDRAGHFRRGAAKERDDRSAHGGGKVHRGRCRWSGAGGRISGAATSSRKVVWPARLMTGPGRPGLLEAGAISAARIRDRQARQRLSSGSGFAPAAQGRLMKDSTGQRLAGPYSAPGSESEPRAVQRARAACPGGRRFRRSLLD